MMSVTHGTPPADYHVDGALVAPGRRVGLVVGPVAEVGIREVGDAEGVHLFPFQASTMHLCVGADRRVRPAWIAGTLASSATRRGIRTRADTAVMGAN